MPRHNQSLKELVDSADEGLSRAGLLDWAKQSRDYRKTSDVALSMEQTRRKLFLLPIAVTGSFFMGYALRNWIK